MAPTSHRTLDAISHRTLDTMTDRALHLVMSHLCAGTDTKFGVALPSALHGHWIGSPQPQRIHPTFPVGRYDTT